LDANPPPVDRHCCIDALGRLGTDSARETVAAYKRDPSPQVRKFAVQALARFNGSETASHLREIAEKARAAWIRQLANRETEKGPVTRHPAGIPASGAETGSPLVQMGRRALRPGVGKELPVA
jgi:hypothetical protein